METILNYDCFPAGMEMFPAMDEAIFEYIKRIIDDSDYYMLIIGGRYGSEDDDGVSWTEKEYDYAVSKDIPVIAFDHKDFTDLSAKKTDQDNKKREKLIAFKKKVAKGRLIKKWTNKDDLALAVSTSLKRVLELQPRIGWVRADSLQNDGAQKEIERLKKEIADRQDEIKRLGLELEEYKTAPITKEKGSQLKTERFAVKGVSFNMIYVEGGTFIMGANEGDKSAAPNEKPAHVVTLSDYWMGETLVTYALWKAVMGGYPSSFKGDPNCPVEQISWDDCQIFIRELNKLTGEKFRMPTEAQWEFAARGGNLGKDHHYLYAGSNQIDVVAWVEKNSNKGAHPVKELEPNELGLYDMTGNVYEWCYDWYDNGYYSDTPTNDPSGPVIGTYRVRRGGSWRELDLYCRVSCRSIGNPKSQYKGVGLRLAL